MCVSHDSAACCHVFQSALQSRQARLCPAHKSGQDKAGVQRQESRQAGRASKANVQKQIAAPWKRTVSVSYRGEVTHVCVCMCVCACACMCVCACVRAIVLMFTYHSQSRVPQGPPQHLPAPVAFPQTPPPCPALPRTLAVAAYSNLPLSVG